MNLLYKLLLKCIAVAKGLATWVLWPLNSVRYYEPIETYAKESETNSLYKSEHWVTVANI